MILVRLCRSFFERGINSFKYSFKKNLLERMLKRKVKVRDRTPDLIFTSPAFRIEKQLLFL